MEVISTVVIEQTNRQALSVLLLPLVEPRSLLLPLMPVKV